MLAGEGRSCKELLFLLARKVQKREEEDDEEEEEEELRAHNAMEEAEEFDTPAAASE